MRGDVRGTLREFGRHPVRDGAYIEDNALYSVKDQKATKVMQLDDLILRGEHNKDNIATAYCAVMSLVGDDIFEKAVRSFSGVEHRIEFVREVNGVKWFNDSIATSPTRTLAGLRSFEEKLILLAGGSDKGLSYEPLADDLVRHVKRLYLSGPTGDKIEKAVREASGGDSLEIIRTVNVEESVKKAAERAEAGDIVMLSPASPSFDSYRNFEERGRHFKELVNAL